MGDNQRLIIAIGLSFAVLTFYNFWQEPTAKPQHIEQTPATQTALDQPVPQAPKIDPNVIVERAQAIEKSQRAFFENACVVGSINLANGNIDDLTLKQYKEKPTSQSQPVTLLSPANTKEGYWLDTQLIKSNPATPNPDELWRITVNTPERIVINLERDDAIFERTFELDNQYVFKITDSVKAKQNIQLSPKWSITRRHAPSDSTMVVHEGGVGVLNGKLQEVAFKDLEGQYQHQGGWLGFTDKYWLVSFISNQKETYRSTYTKENDLCVCESHLPDVLLQGGEEWQHTFHVFAGAKEIQTLDNYEPKLNIDRFDLAVDFGWFYFITKPLFYALQFLKEMCGSLGLAILVMTFISKILVYPLARNSYRSMNRMRELAPKMDAIRKRFKDDQMRMNQEVMALYQKEKVNPLSGCLPQILQAPIFFCLYKVFYVSLEMRHASFLGWIHDLSAPDPTHVFNLFGLLPFTPPSFLHIGLLPLIMGATMLWQQRLSPPPSDPAQAKMMLLMPAVFIFLFSGFPAGVVLYWTFSNVLAIAQQLFEKKRAA